MNTLTDRQYDSAADGAQVRMQEAWQWLCEQHDTAPEDADVWHLRWQQLTHLVNCLLRGEYRLAPLLLCGRGEKRKAIWGAQDALVLKWVALSLQGALPLHASCEHVKGHGGGKQSVQRLHHLLTATEHEKKMPPEGHPPSSRDYRWVCRTDIRGYYRNINKATLLSQVKRHVSSDVLCGLVEQYLHYTVEDGGTFHPPERGITWGCPLSPLMGALHLYDMDAHFSEQEGIHYARYMDDVIILAKSRWQLRRHTRRLMQWFSEYGFEAHPDKTFIGRTEKGFDWTGAWLTQEGVTDIAPRAKANHREKVRRLYERLARVPLWARKREQQRVNARVSAYRKRWTIWAGALLAVSSGAHADGPVVVLASGNVAGDTGARFDASTQASVSTYGLDFGGVCVSHAPGECTNNGQYLAIRTPLGWGITANGYKSIVLVPLMSATLTPDGAAKLPGDIVQALNLSTGEARTQDGRSYQACMPVEGNGMGRSVVYTSSIRSTCPSTTGKLWADTTSSTLRVTGALAVYATGPLSPGPVDLPALYVGVHTSSNSRGVALSKPNRIVVSGLNCNMSLAGSGAMDLGTVVAGRGSGGVAASRRFALTTTCSGVNSTSYAGNTLVGTSFHFSKGANPYEVTAAGQPGFYGTINPGTREMCNKGLAPDAMDTGSAQTYGPGQSGSSKTTRYTFTLCSTGQPQNVGKYDMTVTATLVSA